MYHVRQRRRRHVLQRACLGELFVETFRKDRLASRVRIYLSFNSVRPFSPPLPLPLPLLAPFREPLLLRFIFTHCPHRPQFLFLLQATPFNTVARAASSCIVFVVHLCHSLPIFMSSALLLCTSSATHTTVYIKGSICLLRHAPKHSLSTTPITPLLQVQQERESRNGRSAN
jgi:hypothetical protein